MDDVPFGEKTRIFIAEQEKEFGFVLSVSPKQILAILLIATVVVGTYGGSAYYYGQTLATQNDRTASLAGKLTNSSNQIGSLSAQVSQLQSLNSQLTNQNSQLATQFQQLQSQVDKLHGQVENLTQSHRATNTILVSQGQIPLTGYGAVSYVNFTIPFNTFTATLNVSFTGVEFGVATRVSLLTESQYQAFKTCNCIYYGNYSGISTTWSSPLAHSYAASVDVPYTGKWIIAFQHNSGSGSTETFNETILLTIMSWPASKPLPPTLHTQLYQQNLWYQFSGGAQNQNPLLTLHFNFTSHDPGSDSLELSIFFVGSGNTPPLECQQQGGDCGAVYLLNSTGGPSANNIAYTSICTISANCGTIHYSPVITPVMYVYLGVSVTGSGTVIVSGRHTWTVTTIS